MPEKKLIQIPSTLLNFKLQSGSLNCAPSAAKMTLAKKLLVIILDGETTIPETRDNIRLIQWIQSRARNNTLHLIWYLQQAHALNASVRPVVSSAKPDIWATSSRL